jgi:hypothetical protein
LLYQLSYALPEPVVRIALRRARMARNIGRQLHMVNCKNRCAPVFFQGALQAACGPDEGRHLLRRSRGVTAAIACSGRQFITLGAQKRDWRSRRLTVR